MPDAPRIFRVLLEVSDLDSATAFYSTLLGIKGRSVGGGRCYFDCGAVILGLVDIDRADRKPHAVPSDYYLAVSDLDAVHARASSLGCLSKATVHDEPAGDIVIRPWRERSFYVEDPFGNGLCFVDETTLFTGVDKR